MRWNQRRDVIDRMLADSELQRVPASREHADRLTDHTHPLVIEWTAAPVTPVH